MNYQKQNDVPKTFQQRPNKGQCRVKIIDGEDTVSKAGDDMIVLKCVVSEGQTGEGYGLTEYIVDLPAYPEMASTKIGQILRSCGRDSKLKTVDKAVVKGEQFIGLEGTVKIKYEEYNDNDYAKIAYWITPVQSQNAEDDIPF